MAPHPKRWILPNLAFKLRLNVRGIFDNIGFKIGTRRELQPLRINPEMAW